LRDLSLRPVGDGAHEEHIVANAAVQERHAGGHAEARQGATASADEIEVVVDAEDTGEGVGITGPVAAASGSAQVDGAEHVARGEACILNGETGRLGRDHALGSVGLLSGDDTESDDGVLAGRRMFWHACLPQDDLSRSRADARPNRVRAAA
jgi:hypothetical protein